MTTELRIIQFNVNKSPVISADAARYADQIRCDIISLQEPHDYSNVSNLGTQFKYIKAQCPERVKAAFAVRNSQLNNLAPDPDRSTKTISVLVLTQCVLISMYFAHFNEDKTIRDIEDDLRALEAILNFYAHRPIIVMCDSNAHHVSWGNRTSDARGAAIVNFLESNNLRVINRPDSGPTFIKKVKDKATLRTIKRTSHIDLTIINNKRNRFVFDWSLAKISNTEHRAIIIKINKLNKIIPTERRRINYKRTDWNRFIQIYKSKRPNLNDSLTFESKIKQFNSAIEQAFGRSVKVSKRKQYDSIPWYSPELDSLKTEINKVKRKLTKLVDELLTVANRAKLKSLNHEFKAKLNQNKRQYYERLHDVNGPDDFWKVWGKAKASSAQSIPIFKENKSGTIEENVEVLANAFVPEATFPYNRLSDSTVECGLRETNVEELKEIISKLKPNKCPGPDKLTNPIIKIIFDSDPTYLVNILNLCLANCQIPRSWKTSNLIFFSKPNKPANTPKGYRPIALTTGWSKIIEHLFTVRITEQLEGRSFYSGSQFGFQKGRSTVDAVKKTIRDCKRMKSKLKLMISVDMSSAFDSISWNLIIKNLCDSGIQQAAIKAAESILVDRKVIIGDTKRQTKKGTPQGGKASPAIWVIGLNSLLKRLDKIKYLKVTAYADDINLLIGANSERELQQRLTSVWTEVANWCKGAEVQLNRDKTVYMLIGRRRLKLPLTVEGNSIKLAKSLKYLGVALNNSLSWQTHLKHLQTKTEQIIVRVKKLAWMSQSIKLKDKLKLYNCVFIPTVSYAAETWFEEVKAKSTYTDQLNSLHHRFITALTGAYRCTNRQKLLKLIGVPELSGEIEILQEKKQLDRQNRKAYSKRRRSEEVARLPEFAQTFEDIDTITHRFTIWCIANTGPFRSMLHRLGLADDPSCRYCGYERETSHHLLNNCEFIEIDEATIEGKCIRLVKQLLKNNHL